MPLTYLFLALGPLRPVDFFFVLLIFQKSFFDNDLKDFDSLSKILQKTSAASFLSHFAIIKLLHFKILHIILYFYHIFWKIIITTKSTPKYLNIVTLCTTVRREIRNFPYPSVFELVCRQRLTVKRGIKNVGQLWPPVEGRKECGSRYLYPVTSLGWKR